MRAMSRFSVGTLPLLEELMLFTFHETFILEGLPLFRANGLVDITAVARVQTSTLMFDHLMSAFDCAFVLIRGSVLSANRGEGVLARAIEMRGLGPVKIVTRTFMRKGHIGTLQSTSGSIGHSVLPAHRIVSTITRTRRIGVVVLISC